MFTAPPETPFNFLSLGAGVQSSCLALMAAHGDVGPMPDAAIFADTQCEPASVMRWLDWLETQLPFPVVRVTRGSLTDESLTIRLAKDGTRHWSKSLIPAYIATPGRWIRRGDLLADMMKRAEKEEPNVELFDLNLDPDELIWREPQKGIMGRQCTYNYKVEELTKTARRLAGISHGQKHVTVTQWIGISWDEIQRMKDAKERWSQHRWPLIEMKMTRADCLQWMVDHDYPEPPRSACIYCPFHSDSEWRRLRDQEPEEFAKAIQFERDLQAVKARTDNMQGVPFLHSSMVPLDQVDFTTAEEMGQGAMNFQVECAGMCGV